MTAMAVCSGRARDRTRVPAPTPCFQCWRARRSALKKVMDGRLVSPRNRGAKLYVFSGTSREATQELGGWSSPKVMGKFHRNASGVKGSR